MRLYLSFPALTLINVPDRYMVIMSHTKLLHNKIIRNEKKVYTICKVFFCALLRWNSFDISGVKNM